MQPFVPDQEIRYSSSLSKSRIFHRPFWIIEPKSIKHLRPILNWFRRFSSTRGALTIKRTLLRIVRFWDFRKKVLEVRIQLFTMEMFQNIKLEFAELNWTLYINLQHMQWVLQRPNWRYIIPLANSLTSFIPWCDWLLPTYTFLRTNKKTHLNYWRHSFATPTQNQLLHFRCIFIWNSSDSFIIKTFLKLKQ